METWRPVKGNEGYEVSDLGNIRSKKTNRILKQWKCKNGYAYVSFSIKGEVRKFLVHRLVAEAFIPNLEGLPQVNHKNEKRTDNRSENLEWCTASYNLGYGSRQNGADRNKPVQQMKDGKVIAEYASLKQAADELGFAKSNICHACRGRYKQAYGYEWRYA